MNDQAKEPLPELPAHRLHDALTEDGATDLPSFTPPPESVGVQLARRRQELGWSVEQVAGRLNLAPRQIDALESDNLAALPGLASTRGFVRAYAKLLRIDAAPLVAALTQEAGPQEEAIPLRRPISTTPFAPAKLAPMNRSGSNTWVWVLLAVAVVVVLAAGAWQAGLLKVGAVPLASTPVSTASVPEQSAAPGGGTAPAAWAEGAANAGASASESSGAASAQASPAAVSSAAAVPAGVTATPGLPAAATVGASPAAVPAAPAATPAMTSPSTGSDAGGSTSSGNAVPPVAAARALVIKAREACWIEIKRGDKPVVTRTVQAGSTETIDTTGGVSVVLGNVPGVEVSLAGKPLDLRAKARNNVARVDVKS